MRIQSGYTFEDLVSPDNLLVAWQEFAAGKRGKRDVQAFGLRLMDNLIQLHHDLAHRTYEHGPYHAFSISDPKPRSIHKARVRDRVVHHAIYHALYPFFDQTFIADSYSCRRNKGTHRALNRFQNFGQKVSRNNTRTCWVLQCDIRKFFASIDQEILLHLLALYIPNTRIIWLLEAIIRSFHSTKLGKGLPLGNLTSQLLINVYMNEFDQYAKHVLKAKHYIRYADDFVLLSPDKDWLIQQIPLIENFLSKVLELSLHPDKVRITTLAAGVDFLGWVHFPHHQVLRTTTKRRMFKRLEYHPTTETFQSYVGLLKHGDTYRLRYETLAVYSSWELI